MKIDLQELNGWLCNDVSISVLGLLSDALKEFPGPLDPALPGAVEWQQLAFRSPVSSKLHKKTLGRLRDGRAAYPTFDAPNIFRVVAEDEPGLVLMLRRLRRHVTGYGDGLRRSPASAQAGYTRRVAHFTHARNIGSALRSAEKFRIMKPLSSPIWNALLLQLLLLRIHPFRDGNGRTCRALSAYELWSAGESEARDLPVRKALDANRANDILVKTAIGRSANRDKEIVAVGEAITFDAMLMYVTILAGAGETPPIIELSDLAPAAVASHSKSHL